MPQIQAPQAEKIATQELRYYEADDFQTLNWQLNWTPRYPNRLILRTDSNVSSGWYLKFDLAEVLEENNLLQKIVLELQRKGRTKPELFTFDCTHQTLSGKTIMIGLTTPDWQSDEPCIHAWSLKVIDIDGKVIAASESYGWSYH